MNGYLVLDPIVKIYASAGFGTKLLEPRNMGATF